MLDKQWGHGCNSRSIHCVQIGGSNNSIAAANSLTAGAWVQKSWIMQWRPAGICCPTAISFNIGQASVGITHWLNKSCRQLALLLCPAPSLWGLNFVLGRGKVNKWPKVSNSLMVSFTKKDICLFWIVIMKQYRCLFFFSQI